MSLIIPKDNNPTQIYDHHFGLRCPHCGIPSNITAMSIPRYEFIERFRPSVVGMGYRCDSCGDVIFLRFKVKALDFGNHRVSLEESYEEVERPQETFEFRYLPEAVEQDLREALICYSTSCFNAFAAMSRRCVQSVALDLGAQGKDRVLAQLLDLKEMAQIDDETFNLLKQIVIDGHDASHPHLPSLNADRAKVLLELVKDVLYQLYVRKGKLREAMTLRQEAIAAKRQP